MIPSIFELLRICHDAASGIASFSGVASTVRLKGDRSPVTDADIYIHNVVVERIRQISNLPILSEEGGDVSWDERSKWSEYWLIDPLDGTKEYIKGSAEYTINIAQIRQFKAVMGVVYAPELDRFYFGGVGIGAFRQDGLCAPARAIFCRPPPGPVDNWCVLRGRTSDSGELLDFLRAFSSYQLSAVGSSLKLCMVAEGAADLYPRFGFTSEWDTAAAQAVLEAAGGLVLDSSTLSPLRYNTKESLLNPSFIACAAISPVWGHHIRQGEVTITGVARRGAVVWFTGLSGAGKSTTAEALRIFLSDRGLSVVHLDGDQLRKGLCKDLGFSPSDRSENIRRISDLAKLLAEQGLIVLVSTISPASADRLRARERIRPLPFIEVYVSTPLSICESRDPKGLYKSARAGLIHNFTGIDSPYEPPLQPEVTLDTGRLHNYEAIMVLVDQLLDAGVLTATDTLGNR